MTTAVRKASLAQLCEIHIGRTPSRDKPEFWGNGVHWASISDLGGKDTVISTREQITDQAVKLCGCRIVPEGTLLLSFKLSVGKVAFAGVRLCTNEAIAALKVRDSEKLDPRFLLHYLRSYDYSVHYDRAAKGNTLNKAKLEAISVFLPDIEQQRHIACILDRSDALKRKRQQALKLADDLVSSTFDRLFPPDSPLGQVRLDEVASVETGYAFPSQHFAEVGKGFRLCRGANVFPGELNWGDLACWANPSEQILRRFSLEVGDTILALDRPWISSGLKIAIVKPKDLPALLVQRVARIRSLDGIPSEYFYYLLRRQSFQNHCKPTETTIPHISPVELRAYTFAPPGNRELKHFQSLLKQSQVLKNKLEGALSDADSISKVLSHRYFGAYQNVE